MEQQLSSKDRMFFAGWLKQFEAENNLVKEKAFLYGVVGSPPSEQHPLGPGGIMPSYDEILRKPSFAEYRFVYFTKPFDISKIFSAEVARTPTGFSVDGVMVNEPYVLIVYNNDKREAVEQTLKGIINRHGKNFPGRLLKHPEKKFHVVDVYTSLVLPELITEHQK